MRLTPRLLLAVAAGGAVGACLRHLLDTATPNGDAFPWTTFGINVLGAFLLALLPGVTAIRRSRTWTVALGPGVLGGFTTLSTTSEQGRALIADGHAALAATYLIGTLAACLIAVVLAGSWINEEGES